MTAGQIATPYRQIRTPMLLAALIATFGIGLLTGLVASGTVGRGAQAAAIVSAVQHPSVLAAPLAGAPAAAPQAIDTQDFRGLQDFRAAEGILAAGAPAAAPQGVDTQNLRGLQDFRAAENSQPAPRLGGP